MDNFIVLETLSRQIERGLKEELEKSGIFFRIFTRVKTKESIISKIKKKNYKETSNFLTDLIGIRVTLYFQDDVELVRKVLKQKDNFDHESTDELDIKKFSPVRCNLTFNLHKNERTIFEDVVEEIECIAPKYEVQIRTVLSEGWHEVEHDLRYKCNEDWEGHDDLNRNLNGIFATLETSEFSMLQLFNSLSHRHYKQNNLVGMLKTQFRIRFKNSPIDQQVKSLIESDKSLLKKIHRVNRNKYIQRFYESKITLPITLTNLIFIINHLEVKDERISSLQPNFIKKELELSS